jgi:methylmalonyl-CoA decarboxylase
MKLIKLTIEENVATIALDNYKKRNSLSLSLINEILECFEELKQINTRVVVIRQEGSHHVWSAGHDVSELPIADKDPLPYDDSLLKLLRGVRGFPAPVIAMIHGSVWGGALDFVMNCDMVIADPSSSFAITPAKLGIPYNASGIQHFLKRLPLNIVNELFFTAEPIDAQRALQFNLVNNIIAEEELENYTYQIAKTIVSRSGESIAAFKEQTRIITESGSISPDVFEYIEEIRRKVYCGDDYHEGIESFLAKRTPNFKK